MAKKKSWDPSWSNEHLCWIVEFRVEGRRVRRRLPIYDPSMKELANEAAKNLYKKAWRSELSDDAMATKATFAKAAKAYIAAGGEQRFLDQIITYFGNTTLVNAITSITITEAAEVLYPNAKPETVRRQLKVPIRAVQNFAAGKRREKLKDTRRVRWLTPEEAELLLSAASDPEQAGLRDPRKETLKKIAFMLGTGAGPGETFAADVKGWNSETREWWLPGTKTVFRPRFVYLPDRAVRLIGNLPESGPAFRTPSGQPYIISKNRGGQMSEAFAKVRRAAGLGEDVIPYTLRHTWATWYYAQTKDWGALLDHGGWNRSDTANRYRKIFPSDLGNRLLAHGWDFRKSSGPPVKFGALVSV